MRTAAGFLLVVATTAAAQEKKQSVEIGTSLGVTIVSHSGESFTAFGIPVGQGPAPVFGQGSIYTTFFVSPSVMVEPQVTLTHLSGSGTSITVLGLNAQTGYLFSPLTRNSGYFAASVGVQHFGGDIGDETGFGFGGSMGYRVRVGTGFAIRFEARYRHWVGDFDGINEIGLSMGLGGII